jgi:hypothetical protein
MRRRVDVGNRDAKEVPEVASMVSGGGSGINNLKPIGLSADLGSARVQADIPCPEQDWQVLLAADTKGSVSVEFGA